MLHSLLFTSHFRLFWVVCMSNHLHLQFCWSSCCNHCYLLLPSNFFFYYYSSPFLPLRKYNKPMWRFALKQSNTWALQLCSRTVQTTEDSLAIKRPELMPRPPSWTWRATWCSAATDISHVFLCLTPLPDTACCRMQEFYTVCFPLGLSPASCPLLEVPETSKTPSCKIGPVGSWVGRLWKGMW